MRVGRVGSIVVLLSLSVLIATTVGPIKAEEEYHVIATLQAPTPIEGSEFGFDIALSEDLLLIGEQLTNVGEVIKAGRAYLYNADWNLQTTFQAPEPEQEARFGYSVDFHGDMIVIGCLGYDSEGILNAGEVYVFNSNGSLIFTLQSPDPEERGVFGVDVAIGEDVILVAESGRNEPGFLSAGAVHVYNTEGIYITTLKSPSMTINGYFGDKLVANEDFILIGETGEAFFSYPIVTCSLHVFDYDWNLVTTLQSPEQEEYTFFGASVAISGDLVVIGEQWADVGDNEKAGRAHIYDTNWNLLVTLQAPTPEGDARFGCAVAISGNMVVVGESERNGETVNDGRAYIFDSDGNLLAILQSPEPNLGAMFGYSVDVSEDTIAVGERYATVEGESKAGLVHVFGKGTADFVVDDLSINPSSVSKRETVTVSVECSNEGSMSGSHTVTLKIDGEVEDEKTVTVAPNESTTISFDAPTSEKGTYSVEIEGLTGSYEVKGGIPGFPYESIVISIVLAVIALWLKQNQR